MPETEAEHTFEVDLQWRGGRLGTGSLRGAGLQTGVSVPAAIGGPGSGSNPEELLAGAAAVCYAITLAALLERMRLPLAADITLHSQLSVEAGPPLRVVRVVHRPTIRLAPGADVERARRAAVQAEEYCLVSKALRGNVELLVEPEILVG